MKTLRLHPADQVAVALDAGDGVPAGHKVAVTDIAVGETVRKYGQPIGVATQTIRAGEWVHVHNLGMGDVSGMSVGTAANAVIAQAPRTFQGFARADGRAGTRNYVAIVTSVNCSAHVAKRIAREAEARLGDFPNVDGVVAVTHGGGCGLDSAGEGIVLLRRTLAGYARHANVAGALILGLGCETNQISDLISAEGLVEGDALATATIQESGGSAATIAQGVERVLALMADANRVTRETLPLSLLTVGLQCGGSDGYSGITANPALGVAVDMLVAQGGTAILSETPEIYGAEHLLTARAASPDIAAKLMERVGWWERHVAAAGGSMDNNPSAGNKAGGLTTILEKSLGAVAKAGSSPLAAVYGYADQVRAHGLVFMDTPGYDPVAATGQVAGGANLIAFTTGRGSVFGCKPAPSLKLATNSALYARMAGDMDIDCGRILSADVSIAEMGNEILDLMIATASGQETKSEALGFGEDEIQPWKIGATM